MIRIELGAEPQILVQNSESWGREYELAIANGDANKPQRYRHKDIREALRHETRGKCAYCESLFEHVSFPNIEHILPKSKAPLLVCVWSNLTLACSRCNTSKSDFYEERAPLLNPYIDTVDVELTFHGPMVIDRSDRAKLTISILKLNRSDLLFRRHERLAEAVKIMDLMMAKKTNTAIKNALQADLADKLLRESEYSSCMRCFVSDEGPQRGLELT